MVNYIVTFSNKEFDSLLGRGKRNLIVCGFLLFISIFSIAFSLGAFNQLKERMDNPYTNWVTMPVLYQYRDNLPQLIDYFQKDENKEKFGLKSLNYYVKDASRIYVPALGKYRTWVGRSIDFKEEITSRIFHPSNILAIQDGFDLESKDNLFKYYVTESFCEEVNIDPKKAVGSFLSILDWESNEKIMLFKVGGVLKNLPNHASFIISEELTNLFREPYEKTGFVNSGVETKFTLISQLDQKEKIKALLGEKFSDSESEQINILGLNTIKQTYYTNGFIEDNIRKEIFKATKSSNDSVSFLDNWNMVIDFKNIDNPMYVSFNFKALDKIRDLQAFLKDRYMMEIELSVVEERDNFSMVSQLTYFMIISIIIVSLLSFSIFLYNLIRNHFEKIKPNIGTFMAFGMSGKEINFIYTRTIFKFLVYSWIITFISLLVLFLIFMKFTTFKLDLTHPIILMTFVTYNILAYFLTTLIIRKILSETPGDLIYNRV